MSVGQDVWRWVDGKGSVLDFSDATRWLVLPPENTGQMPLEVVTRETPFGAGGTWVYTRPKIRDDMTFNFLMKAPDWQTQQNLRDQLVAAFSPYNGQGTMTVSRANGTTRAISLVPKDGPKFKKDGRRGMNRIEAVTFVAADPHWYDPATATNTLTFGAATGTPLNRTLNFTLSQGNAPLVLSLTNAGDADVFPVFSVLGQATNPTFYHNASGLVMRWNGKVPVGSTLTFDHTATNPQVTMTDTNGIVTNVWAQLDTGARFFPLTRGPNTVTYSQSELTLPTNVTYSYKHKYSGI